jgi:DNA-binding MarR family transcriptional regulator
MTRLLAVLEDKGLVTRAPHATDGRQVVMTISPEGQALLREDRRRRDAWLAQRMRTLDSDEIEVLRRAAGILDKLAGS